MYMHSRLTKVDVGLYTISYYRYCMMFSMQREVGRGALYCPIVLQ